MLVDAERGRSEAPDLSPLLLPPPTETEISQAVLPMEMKMRNDTANTDTEWFPSESEYSPGLSVQDWTELLMNEKVFTASSLAIMKRIKDFGGMATCKQLSLTYGGSWNLYNIGSSALARRVASVTGCPLLVRNNKNSKWWPVLYVGKDAPKGIDGVYIWKLRPELSEALDRIDLRDVPLFEDGHSGLHTACDEVSRP